MTSRISLVTNRVNLMTNKINRMTKRTNLRSNSIEMIRNKKNLSTILQPANTKQTLSTANKICHEGNRNLN